MSRSLAAVVRRCWPRPCCRGCAARRRPTRPVYRCPGPPVLYTDALTRAGGAATSGCRTIEGAPITVDAEPRRGRAPAAAPRRQRRRARPTARVDPADAARARQRRAPHPRRRAAARGRAAGRACSKEYNNGEPERRGDERNYQKYLDRVAEMKAAHRAQGSRHRRAQARTGQAAAVSPRATAPTPADAARLRGLRPAGHDGGGGRAPTGAACSPTRRSRTCVGLSRRSAACAAACSTGSSTRRSCARRWPRWPATRSPPAASRRSCSAPGSAGGEPLPVHVIVNQIDRPDRVLVEMIEIEQQTRQDREERALGQAQANKELIRNLAHEIKNPLGGIRGAAQLLAMEVELARADRVHPGHHPRGRPPAGAGRPPAGAAPQAARGGRRQHPRGLRARALADPGRVPARAGGASATTTPRSPSSAATASS